VNRRCLAAIGGAGVVAAGAVLVVVGRRARGDRVRAAIERPRRRPDAPGRYRLSVVVPAYQEVGIDATVAAIRATLGPRMGVGGLEIVVVDDGSHDGTAERATSAGADVVVRQPVNRGKGAAVRAGVLAASGRTVVFTDADLAYAPVQILGLLERIEEGWDVVVGSRRHDQTTTLVRARRLREVGGRVINLLTRAVLLGDHHDTQCGLKAFRSDVAELIFSHSHVDGFAFDVEVFVLVERYGLSLAEVPVSVVNSQRSTVRVARDAARLVRDLFRIRSWAALGVYDAASADAVPAELVEPPVARV
jgi:glycosyltransferase involved in cell wall biosynthesis